MGFPPLPISLSLLPSHTHTSHWKVQGISLGRLGLSVVLFKNPEVDISVSSEVGIKYSLCTLQNQPCSLLQWHCCEVLEPHVAIRVCQKSEYQDMAAICHCHAEGSTWASL